MRGEEPGTGRRRIARRSLALILLPGWVALAWPCAAREPAPPPERIAVQLAVLGVGEGTRTLASRRVVLDVGMSEKLEMRVGRRDGGRPVQDLCRLRLGTAAAAGGRVELTVTSQVAQGAGQARQDWRREGRVSLLPGTSAVLEIAPAAEPGERLVVSLTVDPAPGEEITLQPSRVELEMAVWVVQGKEALLLQRPRLRTLTGRAAEFAFDYPVPGEGGEGFEHVRCQLTVTPGYPREGFLPVQIVLSGGFPTAAGPALSERETSALLAAGQSWTTEIQPRDAGGPYLRVAVTAFWAAPDFDGP